MAARKWRRKTILFKSEVTYGTDSTPTGAANAVLVTDLSIEDMQGDKESRNLVRPYFGGQETYHTGPYVQVSFKVELAGSGTAGVAPAYGPILRACGMSETVDPTPVTGKTTYAPVSANEESGTIYVNIDGINWAVVGARGTWKLSIDPGKIPHLEFTFLGLRTTPTDTSLPTPDFTKFTKPLAVNDAHTPTFLLHGYAANLVKASIDYGAKVEYRNVVGAENTQVSDRETKGSVTIEEPLLAVKDFAGIVAAHTLGAMQLVHGTTAGNICEITAPAVQLLEPKRSEDKGIATLDLTTSFVPVGGDDEITLVIR